MRLYSIQTKNIPKIDHMNGFFHLKMNQAHAGSVRHTMFSTDNDLW